LNKVTPEEKMWQISHMTVATEHTISILNKEIFSLHQFFSIESVMKEEPCKEFVSWYATCFPNARDGFGGYIFASQDLI
jgi:hypothetical protein